MVVDFFVHRTWLDVAGLVSGRRASRNGNDRSSAAPGQRLQSVALLRSNAVRETLGQGGGIVGDPVADVPAQHLQHQTNHFG